MKFDIQPGVGALPIKLGMPRKEVRELIGAPKVSFPTYGGSGKSENYADGFVLGYNKQGKVNHIGFSPGDAELSLNGKSLWSANKQKKQQPDPNPALLALDPEPLEYVGFWFYEQLGITTSGYHDGDENQLAITVYPPDSKAEFLAEAERADTSKYRKTKKQRAAKKPTRTGKSGPKKQARSSAKISPAQRIAMEYERLCVLDRKTVRKRPSAEQVVYFVVITRCEKDMNGFASVFEQALSEAELAILVAGLRSIDEPDLAGEFEQGLQWLKKDDFYRHMNWNKVSKSMKTKIEAMGKRIGDRMWDLDEKLLQLLDAAGDRPAPTRKTSKIRK